MYDNRVRLYKSSQSTMVQVSFASSHDGLPACCHPLSVVRFRCGFKNRDMLLAGMEAQSSSTLNQDLDSMMYGKTGYLIRIAWVSRLLCPPRQQS